jgi:hypothetical protein
MYGILNALAVQQESAESLMSALNAKLPRLPSLQKIRDLRVAAAGHPSWQTQGRRLKRFNFVHFSSVTADGFDLQTVNEKKRRTFRRVDLRKVVASQSRMLPRYLRHVIAALKDIEKNHKARFRKPTLAERFLDKLNPEKMNLARVHDIALAIIRELLRRKLVDHAKEWIHESEKRLQSHEPEDLRRFVISLRQAISEIDHLYS